MTSPVWTIRKWHSTIQPPDGNKLEPYWRMGGLSRRENLEMITMANAGMTIKTIARKTHLTQSQVKYRLKVFNIRTTDFRNGHGPFAQMFFERLADEVTLHSIKLIREQVNETESHG